MKASFPALILLILSLSFETKGQISFELVEDTVTIEFKDTMHSIVTDSFTHRLDSVSMKHRQLVKPFKYIGEEPASIVRTWTSDPHFICKYPKEKLEPGKVYSITICFYHRGRPGHFSKTMGFDLSNGERISFYIRGFVIREEYPKIEILK